MGRRTQGATASSRYVRIDGPDGEMCAQSASDWCLIDASVTRRPMRVPDWMAEPAPLAVYWRSASRWAPKRRAPR